MYVLNQVFTPLLKTVIEKYKPGRFPKMRTVILQYSFLANLFYQQIETLVKAAFHFHHSEVLNFRAAQSGNTWFTVQKGKLLQI
jgi:hypothetical protein